MQNLQIEITRCAQIDLDEIWTTIAQTDFLRADRYVAKLEAKISRLSKFPERGPDRSDILPNVRVLIEGQYLIFYRFDGHGVVVMRVVHGARDLGDLDFT